MKAILAAAVITISLVTAGGAKELTSGSPALDSTDWLLSDRLQWDAKSKELTGSALQAWASSVKNSFFSASRNVTERYKPDEFTDIRQRHSYYDYISFAIEFDAKVPSPLRQIRFFHAATSVTTMAEIGMIDGFTVNQLETIFPDIAKNWGVDRATLDFLRDVNRTLFKQNMAVLRNIFFSWKFPKDPRKSAPVEQMDALEFDVAMVDFEQTAVQHHIASNAIPEKVLANVSFLVSRGPVFKWLGTYAQVKPWLRDAGYPKIDFADYRWRAAVGRALVFLFHKKTKDDYVAYMKAHPLAPKARAKLYPAILSPTDVTGDSAGSFTVVGSWKTLKGAQRHLAELRRDHLGIDAVIYPPYGRDMYWTVVVSSFASATVANELNRAARRQKVARDAYVLRRRAVDKLGAPFQIAPQSIDSLNAPKLIRASTEGAGKVVNSNVVTLFRSSELDKANARLSELSARYPAAKFALLKDKEKLEYGVSIASFVSDRAADEAVALARHMSIAEGDIRISNVVDGSLVERIGAFSDSTAVSAIVTKCYAAKHISVRTLKDCSGFWVTRGALVNCILESDCRVLDDTVLSTPDKIGAFLAAQGITLDTELKLDLAQLPFPADSKTLLQTIQSCRNAAQGDNSAFINCIAIQSGAGSAKAAFACASSSTKAQDLAKCLADASGSQQLAKISTCVKGDSQDPQHVVRCLAEGHEVAKLAQMEACLRSTSSAAAALEQCPTGLLSDDERRKIKCLSEARNNRDAMLSCALAESGAPPEAKRAIICAQQAKPMMPSPSA